LPSINIGKLKALNNLLRLRWNELKGMKFVVSTSTSQNKLNVHFFIFCLDIFSNAKGEMNEVEN